MRASIESRYYRVISDLSFIGETSINRIEKRINVEKQINNGMNISITHSIAENYVWHELEGFLEPE